MKDKITFVTGASSNHFNCLLNLLWSIGKFIPTANVVVYNLGLTDDEAKQVPNIRTFDYSKYPSYFDVKANSGRMGFRPVSIQDVAKEFGGIVIWVDAGCLLTGDISELINHTNKNGVYCARTYGTIETTLHPTAKHSLGVKDDISQRRLRDAGIAAFDSGNVKAQTLIDNWVKTALDKNSTAPEGSSRKNHRQDAVFSVLLEQAGFVLDTFRVLNIKMRQDSLTLAEAKRRYEQWRF